MKKLFLILCFILLPSYLFAETCSTVYNEKVCTYTIPWGDETTTNQAPTTDTEIPVLGADYICFQYNSTHVNHTSANWDLNLIFSQTLGGTYDDGTIPYVYYNGLGDNIISSPVCTGPLPHAYMKLREDVNAGTGRISVDVSVHYRIK